jgi:arylsulfatase
MKSMRILLPVLATFFFVSGPAVAQDRPNIVLVYMDNFGYGELGVYGGGITRGGATPRIDTLAGEGLRLTNFNVEAQCTPSRASLMTGRYPIRSGTSTVPITTGLYGLTQWEVTMAEMLSNAGYATGMFGKWHLGHTEGRFPTDQGFDEWYGIPNSTDESLWPDQAQFNAVVEENLSPYAVPEYVYEGRKGSAPEKVKVYDSALRPEIDRDLTDRAKDFIMRSAKTGKPFFAFLPYTQTHMPVVPSKAATATGVMFSCRSTPTLASYWIRSTSLASRTTPSSFSARTTGQRCYPATTAGAVLGGGVISRGWKDRCVFRSSCVGRGRFRQERSRMK